MFNVIAIFVLGMLIGMNTEYQHAVDFYRTGRLEESLQRFESSGIAESDDPWALYWYGTALAFANKSPDFIRPLERAIEISSLPGISTRLGQMMLLHGMWEQGWKYYESRLSMLPHDCQSSPWWNGRPVNDLLIYDEQGAGDSFQFLRYVRLAKHKCRNVRVAPRASGLKSIGDYSSLMSLPLALGLPDPADSPRPPYLYSHPVRREHWAKQLRKVTGVKVGICWQGSQHDAHRSIGFRHFTSLVSIPEVTAFSLQKGHGCEQAIGHKSIVDLSSIIDRTPQDRFADTAAIISELDLVVTCDTSIAHLAGALNVPVWTALSALPDWRWRLKGMTTPWYPTMRLFRQSRFGEWDSVFAEISSALKSFVKGRAG